MRFRKQRKTWYLNLCLSVHHQYGIQMRCESGRHPFYVLFFFCIQFAIWMFCKSTNGYWKDAMQNNKCEVEIGVFVLAVWVLSMCPRPHTRDRPIQNATFYKTIFITYNTCLWVEIVCLPFAVLFCLICFVITCGDDVCRILSVHYISCTVYRGTRHWNTFVCISVDCTKWE